MNLLVFLHFFGQRENAQKFNNFSLYAVIDFNFKLVFMNSQLISFIDTDLASSIILMSEPLVKRQKSQKAQIYNFHSFSGKIKAQSLIQKA